MKRYRFACGVFAGALGCDGSFRRRHRRSTCGPRNCIRQPPTINQTPTPIPGTGRRIGPIEAGQPSTGVARECVLPKIEQIRCRS